jgi:inward rectifier potassium channel
VILLGQPRAVLRDSYHAFLRMRWSASVLAIAAGFMALNFAFALVYLCIGGIANARSGSLLDMLYFSVQTTATIGYGSMYPSTDLANFVVMAESAASLIVTALATGLVFAKFSRTTARVQFSNVAVVTQMDGVPTLMIRIGNERGNTIVGTHVRVMLNRVEQTQEGERYYRYYDLQLTRDYAPALSRSWTVMHIINEQSPLFGVDAATLTAWDAEITASVTGVDDVTMQQLHASHNYDIPDLRWSAKFATMISRRDDGAMVVDLRKFHEVEPLLSDVTR